MKLLSKDKRDVITPDEQAYISAVASEAVEVAEDRLRFPRSVMLPLSARGGGIPGMTERPWTKASARTFTSGLPSIYSLTFERQAPDMLRSTLRAKRTLFEGLLLAAAEKTGRRPSMAEQAADEALDAAESVMALGKPAFKVSLLTALCAMLSQEEEAERTRRMLEARLRAAGLVPQRLFYIAERALLHFQPGGLLFPGLDEPLLLLEEVLPLMPVPSRRIMPSEDAVWIGMHAVEGRDVYYSFRHGFDPSAPAPPHATTLILGEMGAGKTSLMRWVMLQRLLQGKTIVSIDPEGENNALCKAIGGDVIPATVPEDQETCLLHPLDADDPAEMLLAARFLTASIAPDLTLSPGVQAALHEAVQRRWKRRPGKMSLSDLSESLATVNMQETQILMALLRPFQRGGLWEGFFDRPKALLSADFPPGRWWNFDLSSLREENRAIVHSVLSWFLYRTVTVGKIAMDIYIDEGWRLLRSGPFADLLDELGRRARKRGIGVTLITHLPTDLARNATSLNLASTAFIGRLGPDEAYHFFRSIGISDSESRRNAETVAGLPPRIFLAAPAGGRSALFPVRVSIPQLWLDFWKKLGAAR
ncbi:MAG: hypothetical protein HPY45_09810 [Anaerolineae bacterium]|nr:hypothetical protein [Anaerolineae bacterium]